MCETVGITSFSWGLVSRVNCVKVSLKNSTRDHMWPGKKGLSGIKHFYWVQPP